MGFILWAGVELVRRGYGYGIIESQILHSEPEILLNFPIAVLASTLDSLLFSTWNSNPIQLSVTWHCNPTTRQWAEFPRLHPAPKLTSTPSTATSYHPVSTGSCRAVGGSFILSTGRRRPWEVDLDTGLPETMEITNLLRTTPVALEGRLHCTGRHARRLGRAPPPPPPQERWRRWGCSTHCRRRSPLGAAGVQLEAEDGQLRGDVGAQ